MPTRISPLLPRQRWLFLIGLVFTWPMLVNGAPFMFSDTTSYIRSADAAIAKATGHVTIWSDVVAAPPGASVGPAPSTAPHSSFRKNIIIGRSIVYGLILYLGVLTGTLAVPAFLQALLAGAVLIGAGRHFSDPAEAPRDFVRGVLIGSGLAATLTALPYFTGFLMPDLLAGLAIIAATTLLCGWAREPWAWRAFWIGLLCLAALAHTSHILLLGGLGVAAVALRLARALPRVRSPVAAVFAACVVAVAGDAAFQFAIGQVAHRPTVRPPFLAMRLIADGPGAAYLRTACPASGFALCAYRDRTSTNSDVLLWSADPHIGIFTAADAATQRRLAAEQGRFVAAVIARYPGWTVATAARNFARQLGMLGLNEFRTPVLSDPAAAARIPPPVRAAMRTSPAERGTLPTIVYRLVAWPVTLAALALLLIAAGRRWQDHGAIVTLIVTAIVLNAMICGVLSVPSDRYQDRVGWLLVVYAALLWLPNVRFLRVAKPIAAAT